MQLSNSSKQVLLAMVKDEITQLELFVAELQEANRYNYQYADIDKPDETAEYFKDLKAGRNLRREIKKRIKKLAQVSKELKVELKTGRSNIGCLYKPNFVVKFTRTSEE
jgi:hypothetical protein